MYTYIIYYTYLPESRSNTRGGGRPSCQEARGSVAPDLLVTRCHPILLQSTLTLGLNTDFTILLLVDSGLFWLAKYDVPEQLRTIIRQQKDKTQSFLSSCLGQIHFERSADGFKTSKTHRHKNTIQQRHTTTQTRSQKHSRFHTYMPNLWIFINGDQWTMNLYPGQPPDPYMWLPRGALPPPPSSHYFQKLPILWLSETMRKIPGQKITFVM